MFVVRCYVRAVVVTMTIPCSDAAIAPDGDGILMDTAAGGAAGLFATHVDAATDENAHADDAHADDAKADDLDLDAEDPTDKDGDGNGTASMPVNGTQSKPVRTSPITAKDRAVHDHVSAQTDRRNYISMRICTTMVKVRIESIMHCPPIVTVLCTYLPHSMSKNKMSTFLRLRAANKSTVRPISYGMVRRILLLQTHRLEQVRESATKIRDSYFFGICCSVVGDRGLTDF